MDRLVQQLGDWKGFRALVLGDLMVDEQVYGDAERLSGDAPVPVLRVKRIDRRLGGAANVCELLRALGGEVAVIGVVGQDEAADTMRGLLHESGVACDRLVTDADRPTTRKQNLIGLAQQRHPQKMFRLDHESREPLPPALREAVLDSFRAALTECDFVIIEDYAKGVCTEQVCRAAIDAAKAAGKPVYVDPARTGNYAAYRGCTAITPNRTEAEAATGLMTDPDGDPSLNGRVSAKLREELGCEAVVLTLDRHGALLHRDEPTLIPTQARGVYDVTGAGDQFVATLAAGRFNGLEWTDAVRLANAASGLQVESFGIVPIPIGAVHRHLLQQTSGFDGKMVERSDLADEVKLRRRRGERMVFTNGCFDVLHSGHVALLEQAAMFGDFLIVAINDDSSVARLKGPGRPVNSQTDRARVLAALQSVGAVTVFGEDTPMALIDLLRPEVLVKGGDYDRSQVVGADLVDSYGGRVEIIPLVDGKSTTDTIERMRASQ